MRKNRCLPALLLAALLLCARGASGGRASVAVAPALSPTERVLALARDDNRVQEHLRHLSLSIGPRLTGSPGLAAAEHWCRERFEDWGLAAQLEPWGEFPVGFERGPALAWPADQAALDALRERLGGAWVVAPSARGEREWRESVEAALVEAGAAGLITPSRGELVHTGGNHAIDPVDLPRRVRIVLRGNQHEALLARLAANEALDNGTGVSSAMEAARLPAETGARPQRTIRFTNTVWRHRGRTPSPRG